MDLHYTAEENAFRDTLRAFLDTHLPADLQRKVRQHLRLAKDPRLNTRNRPIVNQYREGKAKRTPEGE